MCVRQDVTIARDDEARSSAARRRRVRLRELFRIGNAETAKEIEQRTLRHTAAHGCRTRGLVHLHEHHSVTIFANQWPEVGQGGCIGGRAGADVGTHLSSAAFSGMICLLVLGAAILRARTKRKQEARTAKHVQHPPRNHHDVSLHPVRSAARFRCSNGTCRMKFRLTQVRGTVARHDAFRFRRQPDQPSRSPNDCYCR